MADLNAQAPKFPGSTASCAGRISAEAVPLQISWTVCWQEAVDTGPSGSIAYVFTPTSSDTIWLHSLTASRICNNAFLPRTRRCADCRSAEPKFRYLRRFRALVFG